MNINKFTHTKNYDKEYKYNILVYSNITYQAWKKYNGPHFNSELWVKKDIEELIKLINKGLMC